MRYRADIDGLRALAIIPVLFYQVGALPRLLVDGILYHSPAIANGTRTSGIRERDGTMSRLVTDKGATYVSVYDSVCRGGVCDEFAEGDIPLQFDAGHLTAQGSIQVARRLASILGTR